MASLRIGIVGGSITGAAAAVVLGRLGHNVVVYERTQSRLEERGAALGCNLQAIEHWKELDLLDNDLRGIRPSLRTWCIKDGDAALGRVLYRHPMAIEQHSWGKIFDNLFRRLGTAEYVRGAHVESVTAEDRGATLHLVDGPSQPFDIVIGADGWASSVREALFPSAQRHFAGYVGWRGILHEADVPGMGPIVEEMQCVGTGKGTCLILMMPGPGGTITPGSRGLTWLWYEAQTPTDLLPRHTGADGHVYMDSVPPGHMGPPLLSHVNEMAEEYLPPWHAEVIHRTQDPFLQPIYDNRLDHYVHGRVCLMGDAASTARPHAGSGALKAIGDAIELGDALSEEPSVEAALARYDTKRVKAGDDIVELARSAGDEQILRAPIWSQMDEAAFEEWIGRGSTSRLYFHRRHAPTGPQVPD